MRRAVVAALIVFSAAILAPALADVSNTISVQGILKNLSTDLPLTGDFTVNFSIYDNGTMGQGTLQKSVVKTVTTSNGQFTTQLDMSGVPFNRDYWVQIQVGSEILDPRQRITPSPSAIWANTAGFAIVANALGNIVTLNNGNVGIGTTSPGTSLDVAGAYASIQLRLGRTGDASAGYFDIGADGNILRFRNQSGTDIMSTQQGGNVGIGTTAPTQRLDIANNYLGMSIPGMSQPMTLLFPASEYAILGPQSATNGGVYMVGVTNGASSGTIPMGIYGYSGNATPMVAPVQFRSGKTDGGTGFNPVASTEKAYTFSDSSDNTKYLTIMGSGNVGIGTTTPNSKLVVSGGTLQVANAGTTDIMLNDTTNSKDHVWLLRAGQNSAGDFAVTEQTSFGGTPRLSIINGSGNVGIGTTAPDAKLEVTGRTLLTHITSALQWGVGEGTAGVRSWGFLGEQAVVGAFHLYRSSTNNNTLNTEVLRFTPGTMSYLDGNVGIGTTTPMQKLDVNGNTNINGRIYAGSVQFPDGSLQTSASPASYQVINLSSSTSDRTHYYMCVLMGDKTIQCWGYNDHGELGTGYYNYDRYMPAVVPLPGPAKATVSSTFSQYALLENGQVYAWGYNAYGQLGVGDTYYRYTPARVGNLMNITKLVTSGGYDAPESACALDSLGRIWCWGYNGYGQLGNGNIDGKDSPVQVSGITNAIDIEMSGGQYASACAILSDHTLKCWGRNNNGQLGLSNTADISTPTAVSLFTDVASVTSIGRGDYTYRCAIRTNGDLYCWGYNGYGQLGVGDSSPHPSPAKVDIANVTSVVMGEGYYGSTYVILANGSVRVWGYNGYGQLGVGDAIDKNRPVSLDLTQVNVTKIAFGGTGSYGTACAIMANKSLYCWGYNGYGQVGIGDITDRHSPVRVLGLSGVTNIGSYAYDNTYHFCAITDAGKLSCWGYNGNGELGFDPDFTTYTPVARMVDLGSGSGTVAFWDLFGNRLVPKDMNYKLGIGTQSPSEKLEVAGNIKASGSVTAGAFVGSPSLRLQTSGNTRIYVNGNGNVGIGTDAPSARLDVMGNVQAYKFIGDGSGLYGINTATGGVSNTGSTTIAADTDSTGGDVIAFMTRGTTKVVIRNDGSVGIGTTTFTASQKLYVAGNATVSGDISAMGNANIVGNISGERIMDKYGFVTPVGTIEAYGGTTAPAGWLLCDGANVSRSTYADLFAVIGTSFGAGSASDTNTFTLPDLRGRFLRGVSAGSGNDPDAASRVASATGGNTGNAVGSYQTDDLESHTHGVDQHATQNRCGSSACSVPTVAVSGQSGATGGNETRPVNVYVNYIIKY